MKQGWLTNDGAYHFQFVLRQTRNTLTLWHYKQFIDPATFSCGSKSKWRTFLWYFLNNLPQISISQCSNMFKVSWEELYEFCLKFNLFPVVKEFLKSVKIWRSSRESSAAYFKSAVLFAPLCTMSLCHAATPCIYTSTLSTDQWTWCRCQLSALCRRLWLVLCTQSQCAASEHQWITCESNFQQPAHHYSRRRRQ